MITPHHLIFFTASEVPERLGCCHGPTQAQGQYAQWARKHLHRESLREVSRCRHAALGRLLLRPTETFAGDHGHCRMMGDTIPLMALALQMLGVPPLTHVARMGIAPAAAPKSPFPSRARPTSGLSLGVAPGLFGGLPPSKPFNQEYLVQGSKAGEGSS